MIELFTSICMSLQMNFNLPFAACNTAMMAEYSHSQFESEINSIKNYYDKKANKWSEENRAIVYSGIFVGTIYNTVKTQEMKLAMPIQPLANQLSLDIKPNQDVNCLIEWKWSF